MKASINWRRFFWGYSFSFLASCQSVFNDWSETSSILPPIGCILVSPLFLSVSSAVLGTVDPGLYAVPTSSSCAKDVGAWDVAQSEPRLFLFVYLALGTNLLDCSPYSFNCGVLCGCVLSFECSECISPCHTTCWTSSEHKHLFFLCTRRR